MVTFIVMYVNTLIYNIRPDTSLFSITATVCLPSRDTYLASTSDDKPHTPSNDELLAAIDRRPKTYHRLDVWSKRSNMFQDINLQCENPGSMNACCTLSYNAIMTKARRDIQICMRTRGSMLC
jgi:hypothetical protein